MNRFQTYLVVVSMVLLVSVSRAEAEENDKNGTGQSLIQQVAIGIGVGLILGIVIVVQFFLKRRITKQADAIKEERDRMSEYLESLKKGIFEPEPIPEGDKRNSVLLIGLGGTGKTTLIRSMLHDENADPEVATRQFEIYHKHQKSKSDETTTWLYITDYMGQNIGMLTRAVLLEQKRPHSQMAYGYINSLILMVDLILDPDNTAEGTRKRNPDEDRVNRHLTEWSELALDAMFGLLPSDSLKYVCLFINKVDRMANQAATERYLDAFATLRERLERHCRGHEGVAFEVLVGSAKQGTNVSQLEKSLLSNSVHAVQTDANGDEGES